MLDRVDEARGALRNPRAKAIGIRSAAIFAVVVLSSLLVPVVPFLVGGLLVVAVGGHACAPSLQRFLDPVLRVPVAAPAKRRARLVLLAGAGLLLLVSGAVGAGVHGRLSGELELRRDARALAQQRLDDLVERAKVHLGAGELGEAELVLMEAHAIPADDPGGKQAVADLLERVRRAGDARAILDVLVGLPQREFDAFASGSAVPRDLELGDPSLTRRAVQLARAQIEEARAERARR